VLRRRLVVLLAGACCGRAVAGEVFRCVDDEGEITLRDTPCPTEPATLRKPMAHAASVESETDRVSEAASAASQMVIRAPASGTDANGNRAPAE
jgi:hypothetical protein